MGLDPVVKGCAKPGHEKEWRRLLERSFTDEEFSETEVAHFREICIPGHDNGSNDGTGVRLGGAVGSLSGNIFAGGLVGALVATDATMSFDGNVLAGNANAGIHLAVATASTQVQQNTIASTTQGIDFACNSASLVKSNTFIDTNDPITFLPKGATSPNNTYLGGAQVILTTTCP
jgi:hypothetical protein